MLKLELRYHDTDFKCKTWRSDTDLRIRHAVMPCGTTVDDGRLTTRWVDNIWTRILERTANLSNVSKEHIYDCIKCQLKLVGHIKRNSLRRASDVAYLFSVGIDGKYTSSVESCDGYLKHHGTIEAIRFDDGTVVSNSQCRYVDGWGSNHCPFTPSHHYLPLSTLRDFVCDIRKDLFFQTKPRPKNVHSWNINEQAFRIRDRHGNIRQMLYYYSFLNELPEMCNTVKEAFNILEPIEVRAAKIANMDVKRQGEFWFIPLQGLDDKDVSDVKHATRNSDRYLIYDKAQYLDSKMSHRATRVGTILYGYLDDKLKLTGQTRIALTVCKGRVTHCTQSYNKVLKLGDVWHAVLQNRAVHRWSV